MSSETKEDALSSDVLNELADKLAELVSALNLEVSVEERAIHGNTAYFNLTGNDTSYFLNHKAEPIKSMAFLLQSWFDHIHGETGVDIKVDADGELLRKEEHLRNVAKEACEQLEEVGQEIKLDPMNPYDRRVVHMILGEDNRFETESVGSGHFKSMLIRRIS